MKTKIYSKLIIILALVLCLVACDGAVHLPNRVTDVGLNVYDAEIAINDELQLEATVHPSDCSDIPVTWTSNNEEVATVDKNGLVKGISDGEAIITAKADDKTATCTVTVKFVHVTGVNLNKTSATITADTSELLIATITPSNATNKKVSWSSNDESVATVDSEGKVTGIAFGNAIITAKTDDGGFKASCEVTVPEVPVTGVSLDIHEKTLYLTSGEDNVTLNATVTPNNATDSSVTWESTDLSVATVDTNGKVTAVGQGTTIIKVKTNNGNFTDECTVTVKVHVESVSLNKTSTTIYTGNTETLIPTVLPINATDKSVSWSSSDESVATVDANGVVTAVVAGTSTITATSIDNPEKSASCVVTVSNGIPVTSIELNKESTTIWKDMTETLTVTVLPDNATDKTVVWSSTNTDVATVDETGVVTAIAVGSTTIKATAHDGSGVYDECTVTVDEPLTLEFTGSGKLTVTRPSSSLKYSIVDDSTKHGISFPAGGIDVENGTIVELYANGTGSQQAENMQMIINCNSNCYVYGNAMSLVYSNDDAIKTMPSYVFNCLFKGNTYIINHSSKTLSLPAESISTACYSGMFDGCTGLTKLPIDSLPAQTLKNACYSNMFRGCTSIRDVPYNLLPAETLIASCYSGMFQNCSQLCNSPILPANTLEPNCYIYMFMGCTNLSSITCLASNNINNSTALYFGQGVSSKGTFTIADGADWSSVSNGKPSNFDSITHTTTTANIYCFTGSGNTPISVTIGEKYNNLPENPSKSGYVFNGWYTGSNGTGEHITSKSIVTCFRCLYAYWVAE